jgi:probable F420-dependent oxidoreductase
MQFGIMFANTGRGASPEGAAALLAAAEEGGIDTVWVVEHVVVPSGYQSAYPYDASGKMAGGAEAFDLPDPLIWLAWAAARTTTIELGTGILIATQRNPVVTAKAVASLDHMSGGRMRLGVGVGWLEEEFRALGVPFEGRGRRLDEYIEAMRALWTGEAASFHGEFVNFDDCYCLPRPANGTVPIVIGGHTEVAARRAGRLGDAFYPGRAGLSELARLVELMRRTADEHGRDPDAIKIYASAAESRDDDLDARIAALAELGVAQAIIPAYGPDKLPAIGQNLRARFGSS